MQTSKSKAVAFILAAVLTIVIVGSMVILDEIDSGFKLFLNSLTGHHWVTKSVFITVLFPMFSVIFYFALKSQKIRKTLRADNIWGWALLLIAVTAIFYLASMINYIIHYFG